MKKKIVLSVIAVLLGIAVYALASVVETQSAQALAGSMLDDDNASASLALGSSSAQYTLPTARDPYILCAAGNAAFVLCGSSPTASIAAGGFSIYVPAGSCVGPYRLTGPKCAYIASSATGYLVFEHIDPTL